MITPKCRYLFLLLLLNLVNFNQTAGAQVANRHNITFNSLPISWDEGLPLGNGMLGALVWQRDSSLRISLGRADLWDLRPIREFDLPQFSFAWVQQQLVTGRYDSVQQLFDLPYERDPGPTKLPAGAIEFPLTGLGEVTIANVDLATACATISWSSGANLMVFVDANRYAGWFRMKQPSGIFRPEFKPPGFQGNPGENVSSVDGQSLVRLGYNEPPEQIAGPGYIVQRQRIYGEKSYTVLISWKELAGGVTEGSWIITRPSQDTGLPLPGNFLNEAPSCGFDNAFRDHCKWWSGFWSSSSVTIPDSLLESQWYKEIYKFGSSSRKGAPPVTLQAVWTADNGKLPPWKGDYHNDLNTQLSYWPGYSSNHLDEASAFTDWIIANREVAASYTRRYFHCNGLNYPGVSTIDGSPMGGWIQYALSPTVSAWLAHHVYLQWKYSMDTAYLSQVAWPFVKDVIDFVEALAVEKEGCRQLPLSSSPEINDNSPSAWFNRTTNFDLALVRWLHGAAVEMVTALGKPGAAKDLRKQLKRWPKLCLDSAGSLAIAPGFPFHSSHRHFSHLMAIHPLGLLDINDGAKERLIIEKSLDNLARQGSSSWCGYSYAWQGNLLARAGQGAKAAEALRIFASCFCLPNSFHVNGDQSGTGKSSFTYKPFTLEGNFAFAAGVQEMLLQSNRGIIRVFPAIPESWKNVSFRTMRAEGAFLVSASIVNGMVSEVRIFAEMGGILRLENVFGKNRLIVKGAEKVKFGKNGILEIITLPGQELIFTRL